MTDKITLTNLVNLQNETTAVDAINANNAVITTAFDNTLSRDGTSPNAMNASLDMNSNRILNLPAPVSDFEPLRIIDRTSLNAGVPITVSPLPVGGTINQALIKNSSTNFDVSWHTFPTIPAAGTTHQVLAKNSATDYDYSWTSSGLPVGGTSAQALVKNSSTDYDASWTTLHGLPAGGTVNQVLTKSSGTDYATSWTTPLSGPVSSVIGNIAYFTTTDGTSISGTPSYRATNPSNSSIYSIVTNPPGVYTGTYNGLQFDQGVAFPATQQYLGTAVPVRQSIVGASVVPVGDATTWQAVGVAGYAHGNAGPAAGLGRNLVGIFGQATTSVTGANLFGGNTLATNTDGTTSNLGFDTNYIAGFEVDVNMWKKSGGADPVAAGGHVYGITIAGSSNIAAQIVNSAGMVIDRMSVATTIPWYSGLQTYDGSTTYALNVGAASSPGANVNSQQILFNSYNGSSVLQQANFYCDQNGAFIFRPATGASWNTQDGTGNIALSVGGYGSSNVKLSKLSSVGIIGNDATGILSSIAYGQLPATATNDSAASGKVGEYVESIVTSGSAVSMTTATAKDVATLALTAGDWDVSGVMYWIPAATTNYTLIEASISSTLNTLDTTPGKFVQLIVPGTVTGGSHVSLTIPPYRLSLSGSSTIHFVAFNTFTVSTMTAYCIIRARRVR